MVDALLDSVGEGQPGQCAEEIASDWRSKPKVIEILQARPRRYTRVAL